MGGSPSAPKAQKPKPAVSYKKEVSRTQRSTSKRRPIGAQYLSSRTATPSGSGFGGTKQTLG